jgi:hypothetical protein
VKPEMSRPQFLEPASRRADEPWTAVDARYRQGPQEAVVYRLDTRYPMAHRAFLLDRYGVRIRFYVKIQISMPAHKEPFTKNFSKLLAFISRGD